MSQKMTWSYRECQWSYCNFHVTA